MEFDKLAKIRHRLNLPAAHKPTENAVVAEDYSPVRARKSFRWRSRRIPTA